MIYFLPVGNRTIASSRLRVFNVVPYMKDAQIGVPKRYKKGDVLIIQKAINPNELLKAQKQGAKVIYDIDDNYLNQPDCAEMVRRADLVTVGASYFHKWIPDAPVIDDSLDWDGTKKKKYNDDSKIVGWHGYGNTNYLGAFSGILMDRGYKIMAIVGEKYMPYYEQYDVRKWDVSTIDKNLAECDLCAFYLPGDDDFSQSKGMNKLIKAWAIGIPAFVSYTPEYDRVMRESGQTGFIVQDWNSHDFTKPWNPKMREYALSFTGKRIAKQWQDAIERL